MDTPAWDFQVKSSKAVPAGSHMVSPCCGARRPRFVRGMNLLAVAAYARSVHCVSLQHKLSYSWPHIDEEAKSLNACYSALDAREEHP